jgi:uncharacterized protein (TIGR03437 family)
VGVAGSRREVLKAAGRVLAAPFYAAAVRAASLPYRYPYLQSAGADHITVMWCTLDRNNGAVQYADDRTFRAPRTASARVREFRPAETNLRETFYQYQADITGLTPGTQYFYRILADGQNLLPDAPPDDLRFQTASPGPFTFIAMGDNGELTSGARSIAAALESERPSFVIALGDLAYENATFAEFQQNYFEPLRNVMGRVPFFPVMGNHEYYTGKGAPAVAIHSVPAGTVPPADRGRYYSFDWGDVHFVVLDTNDPLEAAVRGTGRMLDWLDNDLESTRKFWRVACFHRPAYPNDHHKDDPLTVLVRERVTPILEKYDVQLVLNGHEHNYQRTKSIRNGVFVDSDAGTVHITSGGGGARLFPVSPRTWLAASDISYHYMKFEVRGTRMTATAVRADGSVIESFTLAPRPLLSSDTAVVNAASFTPAVGPGGLISIFGRFLAPEDRVAPVTPLPTELGGAEVTLNDVKLPLLFVSRGQINAQLPFNIQGPATLRVSTANGGSQTALTVLDTAPAILTLNYPNGAFPAVLHQDGTLVTDFSPARVGEALSVYLTGLGAVDGAIRAGDAAPTTTLLRAHGPVEVQLGAARFEPLFAGLAPGFVGLYQVNLVVPRLASTVYSLRIVVRGAASNPVIVTVRA